MLRRIGAAGHRALPAFRPFGDECVGFLLTALRPVAFAPGQRLYARGDAAEEMYFVVRGAVLLDCRRPAAAGGAAAAAAAAGGGLLVAAGDAFGLFVDEGR